jgi:TonB family protein
MCKIFTIIFIASLLCGCRSPSAQVDRVAEAVYDQYDRAWILPDKTSKVSIDVMAHIVIEKNGQVLSASIVKPSGDLQIDKSVQRALDTVHRVAPFEVGATNEQRSFIIHFNLKGKP